METNGANHAIDINSEGRPGVFATTINVLPGTHHVRFLVDNQMETSRDLPTTVDFGNNLVNYIEVAPQSTPKEHKGVSAPATVTTTAAASAAAAAAGQGSTGSPQQQKEQQQRQQQQHQQQQQQQQKQQQQQPPQSTAKLLGADSSVELTDRAPKWKSVPEASAFSHELPKFLVDYDQPDDSPDFHTAAAATEVLAMPPSLPGFLGKPILNAATLIKDDNSVLNMPNYTILNHLATSSIKNNILAVSATTRYKDKVRTDNTKIPRCPILSRDSCDTNANCLFSLPRSSSTNRPGAMTNIDLGTGCHGPMAQV